MNNIGAFEVTESPSMNYVAGPVGASYGKERSRIPLGQLSRGKTSRNIITNMGFGVRHNPGARVGAIGVAPNARGFAKHGTRSVSPQPRRAWGGGKRSTVRRASKHARRKHGRRYRSRHTRR